MIPIAERVRAAVPGSAIGGGAADDVRAPLLIGVSGHRDPRPEDVPILKESFRTWLRAVRTRAPHTPVALLCGIAAGADTLAAQVALEEKLDLVACLPFPI